METPSAREVCKRYWTSSLPYLSIVAMVISLYAWLYAYIATDRRVSVNRTKMRGKGWGCTINCNCKFLQ